LSDFLIINLPYGETSCEVNISGRHKVDIVAPPLASPLAKPETAVAHSLEFPVDGYRLEQFSNARTAAIAINDKTRPVLHHLLLPPLLRRLEKMGIQREDIRLIVATGTHAPASVDEIKQTYPPEIVRNYRIISHDCDLSTSLVDLGTTSRGTPVFINKVFLDSDLRIVTGNIEPHHFMGFSGGAKSASIGLAGRQTINVNHAMLVDPRSIAGLYGDNPMRMDIEEIGDMIGIHFALNTIQNDDLQIIHSLAGHPKQVMEHGVPLSRQACQVSVNNLYDLVIASAGGYPKDINLYQSQKALTHAAMITKDGGWVILIAECREGSGSASCEEFLVDINSPTDVISKFKREVFRVGPHKAFQIAREAVRINLVLLSTLPDILAKKFFFTPTDNLSQILTHIQARLPENARIGVMPSATHTIPFFTEKPM